MRVLRSAEVVTKIFPGQGRNFKVGERSVSVNFEVLVMVFFPYLKVPVPPANGGVGDSRS